MTTEVISLRKQLSQQQLAQQQLAQQQLAQQQLAQQQLSQQQQNGVHGIEDSKLLERANSLATRNVSLQVEGISNLVKSYRLKKIGFTSGTGILVFIFHLELELICVFISLCV